MRQSIQTASLLLSLSLLAAFLPANLSAAEPATIESVERCMLDNLPLSTSEQSVRIRSIDRSGSEQALSARLWWRHKPEKDTRLMARIDAPLDLEGAAYLAIQNDGEQTVYSYIPAINRVHRITGKTNKGKLWGTDFSYEDIRYLRAIVTSGALTLDGESSVEGRATWIVTMTPSDPDTSYIKVVNQVDQETCIPLVSEIYEQDGESRKTLTADPLSLSREGERWIARRISMQDNLNNTRTELEVTRIQHDDDISLRTFSPSNFYKIR